MRLIGLTGGIAAGKSTVSAMLVSRGAVLIDADSVYGELVAPGEPLLVALAERFGPSVVLADGNLNRPLLASIVFKDEEARRDLNAITHPAIGRVIVERVARHMGGASIVVIDNPLMRTKKQYGVEVMVVVTAPLEERVRRLRADRATTEDDARARVAAQAYLSDRVNEADFVIDNSGTREDLEEQVDALWRKLTG